MHSIDTDQIGHPDGLLVLSCCISTTFDIILSFVFLFYREEEDKKKKAGTVKFLICGTPDIFAVIYLKFKQRGPT